MRDWFEKVCEALRDQSALVLISTLSVVGSAPREVGAKMLLTGAATVGTIGGGQLEYLACRRARELLAGSEVTSERLSLALGPAAGQCCGGRVELLLEVISNQSAWPGRAREWLVHGDSWVVRRLGAAGVEQTFAVGGDASAAPDELAAQIRHCRATAVINAAGADWLIDPCRAQASEVWLFGAGHVGRAVVRQLLLLHFRVVWIDQRESQLYAGMDQLQRNIDRRLSDDPAGEVADIPAHACVLIMTHSHELDYQLCLQLARRDDCRFVGLIGSHTKAARFRHRLARRGLDASAIHCPIAPGLVSSRRPEAIALAIAIQLTQVCEQHDGGRANGK